MKINENRNRVIHCQDVYICVFLLVSSPTCFPSSSPPTISSSLSPVLQSALLTQTHIEILKMYFGNIAIPSRLLYRSSSDGSNARSFHKYCDKKGPTLILVQAHYQGREYIFGGYIDASWDSFNNKGHGIWARSTEAFLFSLVNDHQQPCKFTLKPHVVDNAVFLHAEFGPWFGSKDTQLIT